MIVVMVIIGLGALLFVPNISGFLPSYRLRGAARDIVSTMKNAQVRAVSTGMTYRVRFTQTPPSFVLEYFDTGSGNWVAEGTSQSLPTGISIVSINFTGDNAQFNSNMTASAGSIRLQNNRGTQKVVSVASSTGRIQLQ